MVCPEGYYGDHCMIPCECKNDNFFCHPAEGCVCKHGFAGKNCEESNILGRVQPIDQESGYGIIIAVIMVSIIFIAIVVLLVFYYRRRVANLKTEIAHVQYIADPTGFSPGIWFTYIFSAYVSYIFVFGFQIAIILIIQYIHIKVVVKGTMNSY
ncbi:hypothetical protein NQ314_015768 [Rhamnusium bicolor]|uniref:EGF-like domain-containing protein n=1 Tax=Rhamnusium bicolor TaxID=1586634 RepID=A0AAV8WXI9_9CUCU|nr:hypothetical protein NQ314_015768 [Rhamnusium bicolor]